MKKLVLLAAVALFGFTVQAQEGFSAKAGLSVVTLKVDAGDANVSDSETGFYIGAGYNFELSETIDLEPAVLYSSVSDLNALYVPVMFKYKVSEEFNILAGPQVNYLLEDLPQGEFGLDIAAGLSYDFSEEFYAEARYGFQISRDIDGLDINTLQIGIGYRF